MMLLVIGIDPNAQRSKNDNRTVDVAFLKHDLLRHKVVWHNDYYKDYFLYLRMEHPFFALFYGHTLHPYNLKERRITFLGIQLSAIGFAAFVTYAIALLQIDGAVAEFSLAFAFDILFGIFVTITSRVYEFAATCEGADRFGKCIRKLIKSTGHCGMAVLLTTSGALGIFFTVFVFNTIETLYPTVNTGGVAVVFIVNYITGLALSWFAIDLIFDTIEFTNEWHRQKGERATCCVVCNANSCCCLSWCCCCCLCYYCCCAKGSVTTLKDYPKDESGNVIGSRTGVFAVTYEDYQSFTNQKPLSPRSLGKVISKIGLNSPSIMSVSSGSGTNNLTDKDALELNIKATSTSE